MFLFQTAFHCWQKILIIRKEVAFFEICLNDDFKIFTQIERMSIAIVFEKKKSHIQKF